MIFFNFFHTEIILNFLWTLNFISKWKFSSNVNRKVNLLERFFMSQKKK